MKIIWALGGIALGLLAAIGVIALIFILYCYGGL